MPTITPENNDEVRFSIVLLTNKGSTALSGYISGRVCDLDAQRSVVSVTIDAKPYKLVALVPINDLEWNSTESAWKVKNPELEIPKLKSGQANISTRNLNDTQLITEYGKWNNEIKSATLHGAALGAANEFREECLREINRRGIILNESREPLNKI